MFVDSYASHRYGGPSICYGQRAKRGRQKYDTPKTEISRPSQLCMLITVYLTVYIMLYLGAYLLLPLLYLRARVAALRE